MTKIFIYFIYKRLTGRRFSSTWCGGLWTLTNFSPWEKTRTTKTNISLDKTECHLLNNVSGQGKIWALPIPHPPFHAVASFLTNSEWYPAYRQQHDWSAADVSWCLVLNLNSKECTPPPPYGASAMPADVGYYRTFTRSRMALSQRSGSEAPFRQHLCIHIHTVCPKYSNIPGSPFQSNTRIFRLSKPTRT